LDNTLANLTVRGTGITGLGQAEVSFSLRSAAGVGNLTVTDCILERGDRGIGFSGDPGTMNVQRNLIARRNILRHHIIPGVVFGWGIQVVPNGAFGTQYSALVEHNRFYDNKNGLFLPSLATLNGTIVAVSHGNIYEAQRRVEGTGGGGIVIFTRDFFNPQGSQGNQTQLISNGDRFWNNVGFGGLQIEGIRRDVAGAPIADNETDVQLIDSTFVKLRPDGSLDGLQNRNTLGLRRDVNLVGNGGLSGAPTSDNLMHLLVRHATSSLAHTPTDASPTPFVVNDNDPGVQITILGSAEAFVRTNDGLNLPADEFFSPGP
jgi:hypothetical protein